MRASVQIPCSECYGKGCEKCKIKLAGDAMDGLKGFIENMIKAKVSRKLETVGTCPPELLKQFKAAIKAENDLEFEREIEERKMKKALEDMFDEREEEIQLKKKQLWHDIEEHLGLGHDVELKINRTTGVVQRYMDTDE